ncbi:arylsulfatase [Sphingobacterium corticibacterium]|uniref:Arylsulfatase n=1 Tax=Sphingobacterium corticibacterium TaxID=2484746 RepID=A0A4Q6XFE9_9SPHI|nr:arylsulfatase [Sphingobacterium corticibacterium]
MKQSFFIKRTASILLLVTISSMVSFGQSNTKPNIIFILADDLGYGDLSVYGGKVQTPNIDRLAHNGILFTNGHSSAATCTPSRYSLVTGEYAWRKQGTGIARGNASLIIDPERTTIADIFHKAGYTNAVIGKWHLGLGPEEGPDWNRDVKPGPLELGFDYSFIIPATGDRVPCVFVENHRVANLDTKDPITVSYDEPIPDEPTYENNPELIKVQSSHGHNQAIVNGIGRIGYMKGGQSALWDDKNIAAVLAAKASAFLETNMSTPFFLYFATHDIHVPRTPHTKFLGKSGLGVRGDAILQLDWTVGQITKTLDHLGLAQKTLIIFSSDNGPVLDDGYVDEAVEKLGDHQPAGALRGNKYSVFEGGTRVPLIISWPGVTAPRTESDALVGQIDFFSSFASLVDQQLVEGDAPDSENVIEAFLGQSKTGRTELVKQAGALAIIKGDWKFIESARTANSNRQKELGRSTEPQLYNLKNDIGETTNLATENPEIVESLGNLLDSIKVSSHASQTNNFN